jgi:hypothetical protein
MLKIITWLKMIWVKYLWGTGTSEDYRNPFWRVTEALAIKPLWSVYLVDLRLFFIRDGKWKCYLKFNEPVTQNFWNGILTFNFYIVKGAWTWTWPIIYTAINSILIGGPYWIWGGNWMLWFVIWIAITVPCWFIHPRYDFVFRPVKDWYFESGIGILFDRGEMGVKPCVIYHNEGSDAQGWDEGSV